MCIVCKLIPSIGDNLCLENEKKLFSLLEPVTKIRWSLTFLNARSLSRPNFPLLLGSTLLLPRLPRDFNFAPKCHEHLS